MKLCKMKLSKEGGNAPRIVVGQIHLSKAPTVKVQIRNKNRTLGETEALLDYEADISLGDLNFLKRIGLWKKRFEKTNGSNYLGCKSKLIPEMWKA